MKKKYYNIAITTLIILGIVLLINFFNIRFLFSFHTFINDKAFTLKESVLPDTNIVLVNLGSLQRNELAQVIKKVSKSEASAIGVHACLEKSKKTPYDSLLADALNSSEKLVLLSRNDSSCIFLPGLQYAPLSLIKDEDEVIRSFSSDSLPYFETQLLKKFNPEMFDDFSKSTTNSEQINYTGNTDHFFAIDHSQILDSAFDSSFLKNKIVLIGYLGPTLSMEVKTLESAVYTPLNEKLAEQKAIPDMYSVVVSANVIATILQNKLIEEVPTFISVLIIICVIIFNLLISAYLVETSIVNFFLFLITAFVTEVFLSGLLIVWLLNDHNQMLYLQQLPLAIIISFIVFFGLHLKYSAEIFSTGKSARQ